MAAHDGAGYISDQEHLNERRWNGARTLATEGRPCDNGVLTISGTHDEARESNGDDYYYAERWAGSFSRSLMLPAGVDADGINATMKHGTLEVHLPKPKEAAGKTIEVKTA